MACIIAMLAYLVYTSLYALDINPFQVYLHAGQSVLDGKSPYLAVRGIALFKYGTWVSLVFGGMALLPPLLFVLIFYGVGIGFYVYALLRLLRVLTPIHQYKRIIVLLFAALGAYVGFMFNQNQLQVNQFLIAWIILGLINYKEGKWLWAALFLAFATTLKIFPLALVLLLFLDFRPKFIIGFIVFTVVLVLAPSAYWGWEYHSSLLQEWIQLNLANTAGRFGKDALFYTSLHAFFELNTGKNFQIPLLFVAGIFGLLLAVVFRVRLRTMQSHHTTYLILLITSYFILFNPRAESPTMILLTPGMILLFLNFIHTRTTYGSTRWNTGSLISLGIIFFLCFLSITDIVPKPARDWLRFHGVQTVGTVLLFLFSWLLLWIKPLSKQVITDCSSFND
jgi:uncharacterized membrane protein